ncbi:MAG: tRNA (adenosine(37)-N6)-threonylcarbamoyltransferase complex dimerization subunit type 1 TsaB, partial [Pseudomonadota bacterium]|nr:tRNA (adenosine(37)-N6)-threonylcarbamoyltransferase complex dimerization subunit type 1 TsaB [Pseudomonadota bacterium]
MTATMPRVLALDAALARCAAAIIEGERPLAWRQQDVVGGHSALLATMVQQVLAASGRTAAELDLVAVTVGPGGFTGIRAALALAHGIGLAAGIPVVGVTVGEALAAALPDLGRRCLWTATDSRRGRVFLERRAGVSAFTLDALPDPDGPITLAGDAAVMVAPRLTAHGCDVTLADVCQPGPQHVALA